MKSCAKRQADNSNKKAQEQKEKDGLHNFNISQKISYATLSVQQARMKEEKKQTKILSFSIQDVVYKSQIESSRQVAMVASPTFDKNNVHWKNVLELMAEHTNLIKKMTSFTGEKNKEVTSSEVVDLSSIADLPLVQQIKINWTKKIFQLTLIKYQTKLIWKIHLYP